MGLAASQARLLTLTSRAIDLEMRCMTLSAATLRNAQESFDLSQEHNDALDALDEASKDPNSEFYIGMKATSYTVNGVSAAIGDMDPSRLENITPFNVDYVVNNNGGTIEHSKYIKDGVSTKSTRSETEIRADIQSTTTSKANNSSKLNESSQKLEELNTKSNEWETTKNNDNEAVNQKNAEIQSKIDNLKNEKAGYESKKQTAEGKIATQNSIISQQSAEASTQASIAKTNKSIYESMQQGIDALKSEYPDTYQDRQDYQSLVRGAGQYSAAWHQAEELEKQAREKVEAAKKAKEEEVQNRDNANNNITRIDGEIAELEKQIVPVSTSPSESNPYTSQIATEQANHDMYQTLVDNDTKKLEELNKELAQVQQPYTKEEQDLLKAIKEDTTGSTFLKALKDGTISIVGPDGKVLNYEDVKKEYNKNNFLPEDDLNNTSPNISVQYSKDKEAYDQEKSRLEREFEQAEKKLSIKDKKIQSEQTFVQTQLNAVNQEKDSVKSLIEKNTEKSFKYGYNA